MARLRAFLGMWGLAPVEKERLRVCGSSRNQDRLPCSSLPQALFCSRSGYRVRRPRGAPVPCPSFTFDATWPKLPLPNKWTFGGVTGLAIDNDDLIWVLHRPNDLNEAENFAALDPPQAECCVMAPAVLAFDRDGNLVHSWDSPQGHLILVDDKDQVWVGSDTFRIHDKQGTLLGALPSAPRLAAPPGGGPRPPQPAYPPDIDVIARGIEGAAFDEAAREVYLVDNYMAGRVMVFDMDQYTFKRGWGAYGKALEDIAPTPRPDFDPSVPLTNYQDFLGHVTIALEGNDVYVADRPANRVQVFTKQGEFRARVPGGARDPRESSPFLVETLRDS